MVLYCLGLIALSLLQHSLCQDEVLSITPSSFTAALSTNSSDRVTFTCSVSQSPPVQVFNVFLGEVGNDLSNFVQARSDLFAERGITIDEGNPTTSISIEPRKMNNKTIILCLVRELLDSAASVVNASFIVQGPLSPPPGLAIEPRPQVMRLTWTPPFTLNITNTDPDITGYRVCFNLSARCVADNTCCVVTGDTMYEYLNIRLPVEFLVTALNMAGESNASSVNHQACDAGMALSHYNTSQPS